MIDGWENIYPKEITINNNTWSGKVIITSSYQEDEIYLYYNNKQLARSNTFTLSDKCISTLSNVTDNVVKSTKENILDYTSSTIDKDTPYTPQGVCIPNNRDLEAPLPISPGISSLPYYLADPPESSLPIVNTNTTTFTWSKPRWGVVSRYALYIRNLETDVLEVYNENINTNSYVYNNLKPNSKYKWNVRAKDNAGKGGWLSDPMYFKVGAVAPTVTDTGEIRILVVDENDNPIVGESVSIRCNPLPDSPCPPTLQEIPGLSGSDGFAIFSKKNYPYKSATYSIGNGINKKDTLINFEPNNKTFSLAIKNKQTGIVDMYTAIRMNDSLDSIGAFTEGVYDVASIQFSIEGLEVGATAETTSFVINKVKDKLVLKYGATIAGKFALKFVPGVGYIYIVATAGYIVYDNYDDTMRCADTYVGKDTDGNYLDTDTQLSWRPSYFCGRIATKGALTLAGVGASRLVGSKLTPYLSKKYANKIANETVTLTEDVWIYGWSKRGFKIDEALGNNIGSNFKGIDIYDPSTRTVTSIKSLDTQASSYQTQSDLYNKLKVYADKLNVFEGYKQGDINIKPENIGSRVLNLAIPPDTLTIYQQQAIKQAKKYVEPMNLLFKVTIIKS